MIEVKEQYPYIDGEGNERTNLVKHWAEDENGKKYLMLQVETGIKYGEAVDVYPCRYTYEATEELDGVEEEESQEAEKTEE